MNPNFPGLISKAIGFISATAERQNIPLLRAYLAAATFWTLLLLGSLAWNIHHERRQIMTQAYAEARANYNKDMTFRRWGNSHGGVYVPITDTQQPVPGLADVPGRDAETTDGRRLTLLNPATMVRQMMDRYEADYGIRGRITGLKQLNPDNAPDAWERQALEAFTRGESTELWEVADMDGAPHLRYLHAMRMEPGCDKCHAILGYKTGDVRGATGINLPLAPYYASIAASAGMLGTSHAAIWLIGLIGMLVTYRKQDQQSQRALAANGRLAASDARASQIIENASNAMLVVDADGCILSTNGRVDTLFGYAGSELVGQAVEVLLPESVHERHREVRAAYARHPEPRAMGKGRDLLARRKDGGTFPVEVSLAPMAVDKGMQVIVTVADITERKRMTEELERHRDHLEELVAERTVDLTAAQAEMERLAAAKSEFLANMSHEIRTPLNAVLGLARIGARDSAGEASHKTFVRIQDSGTHLLGVINDILDFSKLDAGKLHVERRPFALGSALDNAVNFVSSAAREKGLAVEVTVAADLPQWVSGDAQRFQQIMANLLSNAVKFTERGEVRLRVAPDGEDVWFKVIDTGIGMTEDQAARLFQPFEQADSSTTRKYGGTGLGLAISQNLARLMGGEITVDRAPGAGCSFTLRLPLPPADPGFQARAEPVAGSARRLAGLRLLAAEDVEVNRLILEDLLSHEGAHVIFAEDGQQALDRLEETGVSTFDAVLMDVQMPVMNGLEATRRLRKMAPALPVIGLTAHAFAEERDKCLAAGMAEHLTKPIDADLLVAAILRHARPDASVSAQAPPVPAATNPSAVPPAPTFTTGLIDWPGLQARYPGRAAFVTRLATIARDSQRETPAKLRAAAAQQDLDALAFVAHSVKGAAGNLVAPGVQDLAARTEIAARKNDPQATALAIELADQMDALLAELAARVQGS